MTAMRALCRRFWLDKAAIAAVEFALVFPFMIVLLTGVAELSFYMMAVRRVSVCAETVADLVGRATSVTSSDMTDIYQAAQYIIEPFSTSAMTIGVVSVRYNDSTGVAYEDWTSSYNGGTVSNATTQASSLGNAGESVIVVGISFTYTPVLNAIISTTVTLTDTAIVRPRLVDYVTSS